MKLRQHQFSIQPRIFDGGYEHPWYQHVAKENGCVRKSDMAWPIVEFYGKDNLELHRPNPPTKEAIEKARFVDRTYRWNRDSSN